MPKTIAEKIFSKKLGKDVKALDFVIADIDFCMGQDGTSPLAIEAFNRMGGERLFAPRKVALVIDHSAPSPTEGTSRLHKLMREFADKQNCILYDIGEGVCHTVIREKGHIGPGNLVVGADSHTCTYGALNLLSTGVGSTDLAAVWITGKLWFKVPESMKIKCYGILNKGVYAKDLALFLVGQITSDGATYLSIEYSGETFTNLSMEGRFTICNLTVEMGAKFGIMECDDKTKEWLKQHSSKDFEEIKPDKNANYVKILEYNVKGLEPQVAIPHAVDKVCNVRKVGGTPIHQAFIGTCTNGSLEDLKQAAEILQGQKVNPKVRLIVAPASRKILQEGIEQGIMHTLIHSGAAIVTPGCGCCVGTHNGIPADGENVISTANRNFKGRMGNSKAAIFLASPATVAASAIPGVITDPRKFL